MIIIIIAGNLISDIHTHAHYVLCSRAYFTGLIFAVRLSSVKIGYLEISHYTVVIQH